MARKRKNTRTSAELTAESKERFKKIALNIEDVNVDDWLKNNFIPYAWSYNLNRALVDVSGLKPVQRRILWVMYKNGLSPNSTRMKVSTISGSVLKFHAHDSKAVDGSLKGMAQAHTCRVPLVDGKGNFGSPGSEAAAGRYIEARLTPAGWLNVEDIGKNAVMMVPSYDNTDVEPSRIPVKWPVGMVNGGSGMAVAYASNIPSHNPTEIMQACEYLVKHPDASHAKLASIIKGPDFNMGGLIPTVDGIEEYLRTGSGTFTLQGRYEEEAISRGQTRLDFYEIPHGTSPEKVLAGIQNQMEKGKLSDIAEYKNLSDRQHPIRVMIVLKSGAQKKKTIDDLFRLTPLQVRFSVNMTTVVNNKPTQSSMKDILLDFIEFRKQCIMNALKFEMPKIDNRVHLIDGILKVLLDIDAAIKIIRGSNTVDDARAKLCKKFKIDDAQANYVLSLQLRRLTKMDSADVKTERKTLADRLSIIKTLLSDEKKFNEYLIDEFRATEKIIGDERKTEIVGLTEEEYHSQQAEEARKIRAASKGTQTWVYQTPDGRILKTLSRIPSYSDATSSTSRTRKPGTGSAASKPSPFLSEYKTAGNASIAVIGTDGVSYPLSLASIDDDKPIDPVKTGILPNGVKSAGFLAAGDHTVLIVTRRGGVRNVKISVNGTATDVSDARPIIRMDDGDSVVSIVDTTKTPAGAAVILVTRHGRALKFPLASMKPCNAGAQTVAGMRLDAKTRDEVVAATVARKPNAGILTTVSSVTVKNTPLSEIPTNGRGTGGAQLHPVLPTDSIENAGVDTLLVNRGKVIDGPAPTPRTARPAPLKRGTVFAV